MATKTANGVGFLLWAVGGLCVCGFFCFFLYDKLISMSQKEFSLFGESME